MVTNQSARPEALHQQRDEVAAAARREWALVHLEVAVRTRRPQKDHGVASLQARAATSRSCARMTGQTPRKKVQRRSVVTDVTAQAQVTVHVAAMLEKRALAQTGRKARLLTVKGTRAVTEGARAVTEGARVGIDREARVEIGREAQCVSGGEARVEKEGQAKTGSEGGARVKKGREARVGTERGAGAENEKGAKVVSEKEAKVVIGEGAKAGTEEEAEAVTVREAKAGNGVRVLDAVEHAQLEREAAAGLVEAAATTRPKGVAKAERGYVSGEARARGETQAGGSLGTERRQGRA